MTWRTLLLLAALVACGEGSKADDDDDGGDEDEDEDEAEDDTGGAAGPLALAVVLDNSASMVEEVGALARALPTLDAARGDRELRLVAVTPSVDFSGGASADIDPGEAGVPIAAARTSSDPDWLLAFTRDLLCDAAYWSSSAVPRDASYECDPDAPAAPSVVSQEYLDCLCGFGEWEDNAAGSGQEEPLEAALMLGCRADPDPPEACFDPLSPFASSTDQTVADWPGDDVLQTHVLVVSDEGDNSRRLPTGAVDPDAYLEAFAALPTPPTISFIGIGIEEETGSPVCPSTTIPVWSLERMVDAAEQTGGDVWPIAELTGSGDCVVPDLAPALEAWVTSR